MFTTRTASVLFCAVLTMGMDQSPTTGGYNAGASPKAISPEEFARLQRGDVTPKAEEKPFTAYGDAPEECTLVAMKGAPESFPISIDAAKQSTLVANMIEDGAAGEDIPLINVSAKTLTQIVKYMEYHTANGAPEDIQKPLKSTSLVECGVSQWDNDFVELPQEDLFELILAANYMDIKTLLDLTCAKVASMIKGKTTEEIRKQFNIVNDFTPEEEAQVREENRWCEDQ